MKNLFLSLFSLVLLLGFCSGCEKEKEEEKLPDKDLEVVEEKIEGFSYKVGYLDINRNIDTVLNDYDSFKTYFKKHTNYTYDGQGNIASSSTDNILDKYDANFFKDNSLAVMYVVLNSGSITIDNVYGVVDDNKVTIEYTRKSPEVGTMDMSGCFVIVEVPKTVTEIGN